MTGSWACPAHRGCGHPCGVCRLLSSVLNPRESGVLVGRSGFRLELSWPRGGRGHAGAETRADWTWVPCDPSDVLGRPRWSQCGFGPSTSLVAPSRQVTCGHVQMPCDGAAAALWVSPGASPAPGARLVRQLGGSPLGDICGV